MTGAGIALFVGFVAVVAGVGMIFSQSFRIKVLECARDFADKEIDALVKQVDDERMGAIDRALRSSVREATAVRALADITNMATPNMAHIGTRMVERANLALEVLGHEDE